MTMSDKLIAITFYGDTHDDLTKQIAAYLSQSSSSTVVTGAADKVATDAARAAGGSATTVKPKTAAEKKAEKEAEKAAAEAAAAEEEDPLAEDEATGKTLDDLREILNEYREKSGGQSKVLVDFFAFFGIKKVIDLPADKYDEAYAKAAALIAKIK